MCVVVTRSAVDRNWAASWLCDFLAFATREFSPLFPGVICDGKPQLPVAAAKNSRLSMFDAARLLAVWDASVEWGRH